MGADITVFSEKKKENGMWELLDNVKPFDWRSYGMYGFLADIRNFSCVPVISERRGIPDDVSPYIKQIVDDYCFGNFGHSWLTIEELLSFDYDQIFEDRRCSINGNGGSICEPGQGKQTTIREFLGEGFFNSLHEAKEAGAERIIFWFDC